MNWSQLVLSIQAEGWSQPQIAAECRCAQSTISDIAAGRTKDPRFSIGAGLRSLAQRLNLVVAESEPNQPPALTHKAQAATESVAKGAAHA